MVFLCDAGYTCIQGDPELEFVRKPLEQWMPTLPKPLNYEEKKYLLSVERGDMGNVKR